VHKPSKGALAIMRYKNLRFSYLLTYLLRQVQHPAAFVKSRSNLAPAKYPAGFPVLAGFHLPPPENLLLLQQAVACCLHA